MSPQWLPAAEKNLGGGFKVRRLLPAAGRRSVGPFVFFDHFGPVTEQPGESHDVRPHPHIGLATVTYLFEGAMLHRDSLGTEQLIEPGALNWMSAGRGIVHSERKPEAWRQRRFVNHGLQLWVALPAAAQEGEPSFSHTPAADIPELAVQGVQVRVLVGEAFGARSPVPAASPTLYLDLHLPAGGQIELPPLAREMALYTVTGSVRLQGADAPLLEPGRLAVLAPGTGATLIAQQRSRVAVVGGEPLGLRHLWWNFVSCRPERIAQAAQDWEAGRFAAVPGDAEFIPLPAHRFTLPPRDDVVAPTPTGTGPAPQIL